MQNSVGSKGFRALMVSQFLGAFNDNLFKFIVSLVAIETGAGTTGVALAGLFFILPFLLFSMIAGYLADRYSKKKIILLTNISEILVMLLGGVAFYSDNFSFMLAVLFLMGTQSAFFSPAKYGIIPEILSRNELSKGNGITQMYTFLAIILGTAAGGIVMSAAGKELYRVSYLLVLIAVAGYLFSLKVKDVAPGGGTRTFRINFISEACSTMSGLKNKTLSASISGIVFFWFISALFQMNLTVYAGEMLGLAKTGTGMVLATVALGIGAGSMLAGSMSGNKVELGLVPMGALVMSVSTLVLGSFYSNLPVTVTALVALGAGGGFFIVPLNTFIQQESPRQNLGKNLSAMNLFSFTGMLCASALFWLLSGPVGLNPAEIFFVNGAGIMLASILLCRQLPRLFFRFIIWLATHIFYRINITGNEHIPDNGAALLVCNHVSYIDALIINAVMQKLVRFMLIKQIFDNRWLNTFFRMMHVIPIDPDGGPKELIGSLRMARTAIMNGHLVCIFAEGGITRTGNLLPFRPGLEHIVKGTGVPILPVYIDRVWGSIFSFERGRFIFKCPQYLPYPVTIAFKAPMSSESSAFQVRSAVQELGAEAFSARKTDQRPLHIAFWKEARRHPDKCLMKESSGRSLTCSEAVVASVMISKNIRTKTISDTYNVDNVGILLPESINCALVNMAVVMAGKRGVNLDRHASLKQLSAYMDQVGSNLVISSRQFIKEVLNLEIDKLKAKFQIILIDDLTAGFKKSEEIRLYLRAFFLPACISRRLLFKKTGNLDTAVAIFFKQSANESGKQLFLSGRNTISAIEGVQQVLKLEKNDILAGTLPLTLSSGYIFSIWFPLLTGIGVAYYTEPMEPEPAASLIKQTAVTILPATTSCLNLLTRKCSKDDLASLRMVLTVADEPPNSIADDFRDRFGILPMKVYGVVDVAPVISVSVEDYESDGIFQKGYKKNSVGHPVPGMAVRIVNPDTFKNVEPGETGTLLVKGTAVIQTAEKPTGCDGWNNRWYDTGDIARLDSDGFIWLIPRKLMNNSEYMI